MGIGLRKKARAAFHRQAEQQRPCGERGGPWHLKGLQVTNMMAEHLVEGAGGGIHHDRGIGTAARAAIQHVPA